MKVTLSIQVDVNTDLLDADERAWLAEECESDGFPVTEENLAWYAAEALTNETGIFGYAVSAKVVA